MSSDGLLSGTVKKTAKHSLIYGLGTSITALSGLILVPLYTRFLAPSEYGVFSLISIVFSLLFFLYDFGMINALFRWYYQYEPHETALRQRVVSTAYIFTASLAFIFTVLFWIVAPLISQVILSSTAYTGVIRLMLAAVFLQSLTMIPLSVLRIKERVVTFTVIAVSGILFLALANLYFLSQGKGVSGIYAGYIATYLCMAVILFILTKRGQSVSFSFAELKGMLKFGLPYVPVLFFSWAIDYSDRYILGHMVELNQVGLYSVGYKIGQVLYVADKTFLIAWMPLLLPLSQQYKEKAQYVCGRVFTYFIFATGSIFLAISLFSREIIAVFASAAYADAAMVIPWVALAYFFYGIYIFMLSSLIVAKNIYAQPIILLAAAGANILLNILLIPRFGMMGSAYATGVSYCIAAVATYIFAQKYYPITVEWRRLGKILGAAAVILFSGSLLHFDGIMAAFAYKAVMLIAFLLILFAARFFKDEELLKMKTMLLRLRYGQAV